MKTLGLIATLHSGLTDLKHHGQEQRLLGNYFKAYLKAFDRLHYFSYFDEKISDFTADSELLEKVVIYGKPSWCPDKLYAFLMPLIHGKAFRACEAYRVFQAIGVFPLVIPSVLGRAPALITFGYDYSEFARLRNKGRITRWFISLAERTALHLADRLLVPNRLPERYESEIPEEKIVSVPNGADTALFRPVEKQPASESKEKTILFVGRLEKQKNLECLFRAAAKLSDRFKLKLVLIGEGSEKTMLERLAAELKLRVDFLAPVPHEKLVEFYHRADVFVLPSWTEGHPKVLLEAMSCGAPCVISSCRAHETILRNGEEGLLFDPNSADECADRIASVLSEPSFAEKLGRGARSRVLDRYDLVKNIERETKVLQELSHG